MTGQADGTVYINSKLDASGLKPGSKEIEVACRRAAKTVRGIGDAAKIALERQVNAFVKQNQMYAQQEQKVESLKKKLDEMSKQKISTAAYSEVEKEISKLETALDKAAQKQKELVESGKDTSLTPEYAAASKQVEKLDNALLNAYNRKEKFLESGGSESSRTFKNIEYDIARIERQLQQATADKEKLESSKTQKTDAFIGLEKEIEDIKQSLAEANAQKEKLETSGGAYKAVDTSEVSNKLIAETQRLSQMNNTLMVSYDALRNKVEQYGGIMADLSNRHALLRKAFGSVYGAVKYGASIVGKVAHTAYNSFLKVVNKLKNAMLGLHKNTQKSNSSINLGIKNILKYTLSVSGLIAILKKIGSAAKEGFSNLYEENVILKNSVDNLRASLLTLKNALAAAFAPIAQIAIPYIQRLVEWITKAVNLVGQLIAALTGKKTYTKAITQTAKATDSTAKAADKAAKATEKEADALKDAEKAADGYLSPLDEINKYEDNSTDISLDIPSDIDDTLKDELGDIGDSLETMFEEIPIENSILDAAEKIKSVLSALFEPLLEAWKREGKFVMDSWKYALDEVWKLIKDIGRDFLKVWQEEATIKIFQNILHIIGDIGLIVGNLARNFREAWNTNEVGLNILRNIRDVIGIIVQHIRNAADATVEWADKLDFYPILDAFERFLDSIKPVVDAAWGVLEDFYTKVLLPLSKWAIEKGLPEFLQVLIDFNNKVDWESLRKNLAEFWEHLEPFAETVGEGLIIFIRRVSDALANFLNSKEFKDFLVSVENWMDKVTPQDVADAMVSIAKGLITLKVALLGFSAISAITGVITTVKTFLSFFGGAAGATVAGNIETTSTALSGFAAVLSDFAIATAAAVAAVEPFKDKMIELAEKNGAQAQTVADAKNQYDGFTGTLRLVRDEVKGLILGIDGLPVTIASSVGAVDALNKAMEAVAEGTIYSDEQLRKMQETWGFTADDIEMLRQEMLDTHPELRNLADQFPALSDASAESLAQISAGLGYVQNGLLDTDNVAAGVEHRFGELTPTAEAFFNSMGDGTRAIEDINYELETGEQVIDGYVASLQGASESTKSTVSENSESIKKTISDAWENIKSKTSEIWGNIKSILSEKWSDLKSTASEKFNDIKTKISDAWNNAKSDSSSKWNGIKSDVQGIWNSMISTAQSTGNDIKNKLLDAFESLKSSARSIFEDIKSTLSDLWDSVKSKASSIGSTLSSAFGKSTYSISASGIQIPVSPVPSIATANIPYLASGAVIPPNAPFLAVLGDQKRGTNVEAPISAIEDAVVNAMSKMGLGQGFNGTINLKVFLTGKQVYEEVIEQGRIQQMMTGRNGFELA